MNKVALINAFYVSDSNTDLGKYYVDLYQKYLNKEDIFIGINTNNNTSITSEIQNLYLNVGIVSEEKYIDSDASGYQKALELLITTNKDYKYLLFAHTKGGSYNNSEMSLGFRNEIEEKYFKNIDHLTTIMNNNPEVGCLGYFYMQDGCVIDEHYQLLKNYSTNPYKIINGFFANSFYLVKFEIIKEFLKNNSVFLEKSLIEQGFNRYFFESFFTKIVSLHGFDVGHINSNNEFQIIINTKEIWN